jgi:hypothetical protein
MRCGSLSTWSSGRNGPSGRGRIFDQVMSAAKMDYEQGIARLIALVKEIEGGKGAVKWSPTPSREALLAIADRLAELRCDLETPSSATFDIENEHDKEYPPQVGVDGMPIPTEPWGCSYAATLMHMRELEASARRAAAALPDARTRNALPTAALGLLWLRLEHGYGRPRLSNDSDDVKELGRVCESAGLHKSPVTLRNALSKALEAYDPHQMPPWAWEVVTGG